MALIESSSHNQITVNGIVDFKIIAKLLQIKHSQMSYLIFRLFKIWNVRNKILYNWLKRLAHIIIFILSFTEVHLLLQRTNLVKPRQDDYKAREPHQLSRLIPSTINVSNEAEEASVIHLLKTPQLRMRKSCNKAKKVLRKWSLPFKWFKSDKILEINHDHKIMFYRNYRMQASLPSYFSMRVAGDQMKMFHHYNTETCHCMW